MKKFLRRILAGLVGLLVLMVLFHVEENWRGRRAWDDWKREREAAGDSYEWASIIPPPVPDSENFAMHPAVAHAVKGPKGLEIALESQISPRGGFMEGRTEDLDAWKEALQNPDLMAALESKAADMNRIVEASLRPKSRLPLDYEKQEIPSLLGFRAMTRVFRLRALARLAAGQNEAALEDVLTILRLAQHFQKEPSLISSLLHGALVNIAMQPVWEGLSGRRWNDAQLVRLQSALSLLDELECIRRGWQGERALQYQDWVRLFNQPGWAAAHAGFDFQGADEASKQGFIASFIGWVLIPKGWFYLNHRTFDRFWVDCPLKAIDVPGHRVDPSTHAAFQRWIEDTRWNPSSFIARRAVPALMGQNLRFARTQVAVDHAVIVCALERYRLVKGTYPASLTDLAPGQLDKLPSDVIGGQPYNYRRVPDGSFKLWSVGWDGKDDDGQLVLEGDYLLYRMEGEAELADEQVLQNRQARVQRSLERGDWPWVQPSR